MVSLLCPTYGRFPTHGHLLEEVVYWFLKQDYPADRRELLICNDAPEQDLRCGFPGVHVFNLPGRVPSLGGKLNFLVHAARGSILMRQDDDDISLPWRVTQAVERLGSFDYWNPGQSWWEDRGTLRSDHKHGVLQNASAWRASAGLAFDASLSGDEDQAFDRLARRTTVMSKWELKYPSDWQYIYRWGVSPHHLSGPGTPTRMRAAYAARTAEPGVFRIHPRVRRDYAQETRELITSLRAS